MDLTGVLAGKEVTLRISNGDFGMQRDGFAVDQLVGKLPKLKITGIKKTLESSS